MKPKFDSEWTPAIMIVVFFVIIFSIAYSAFGATKDDLRDKLIATGNYLEVGTAIPLRAERGQAGMSARRYYIAVLTPGADSLVASQRAFYIWVVDDSLPTEAAYFANDDPTIIPTPPTTFYYTVITKMENLGIEGAITETGVVGNKEWALVDRYNPADTGQFTITKYKVTRTDGTTWQLDSLVQ